MSISPARFALPLPLLPSALDYLEKQLKVAVDEKKFFRTTVNVNPSSCHSLFNIWINGREIAILTPSNSDKAVVDLMLKNWNYFGAHRVDCLMEVTRHSETSLDINAYLDAWISESTGSLQRGYNFNYGKLECLTLEDVRRHVSSNHPFVSKPIAVSGTRILSSKPTFDNIKFGFSQVIAKVYPDFEKEFALANNEAKYFATTATLVYRQAGLEDSSSIAVYVTRQQRFAFTRNTLDPNKFEALVKLIREGGSTTLFVDVAIYAVRGYGGYGYCFSFDIRQNGDKIEASHYYANNTFYPITCEKMEKIRKEFRNLLQTKESAPSSPQTTKNSDSVSSTRFGTYVSIVPGSASLLNSLCEVEDGTRSFFRLRSAISWQPGEGEYVCVSLRDKMIGHILRDKHLITQILEHESHNKSTSFSQYVDSILEIDKRTKGVVRYNMYLDISATNSGSGYERYCSPYWFSCEPVTHTQLAAILNGNHPLLKNDPLNGNGTQPIPSQENRPMSKTDVDYRYNGMVTLVPLGSNYIYLRCYVNEGEVKLFFAVVNLRWRIGGGENFDVEITDHPYGKMPSDYYVGALLCSGSYAHYVNFFTSNKSKDFVAEADAIIEIDRRDNRNTVRMFVDCPADGSFVRKYEAPYIKSITHEKFATMTDNRHPFLATVTSESPKKDAVRVVPLPTARFALPVPVDPLLVEDILATRAIEKTELKSVFVRVTLRCSNNEIDLHYRNKIRGVITCNNTGEGRFETIQEAVLSHGGALSLDAALIVWRSFAGSFFYAWNLDFYYAENDRGYDYGQNFTETDLIVTDLEGLEQLRNTTVQSRLPVAKDDLDTFTLPIYLPNHCAAALHRQFSVIAHGSGCFRVGVSVNKDLYVFFRDKYIGNVSDDLKNEYINTLGSASSGSRKKVYPIDMLVKVDYKMGIFRRVQAFLPVNPKTHLLITEGKEKTDYYSAIQGSNPVLNTSSGESFKPVSFFKEVKISKLKKFFFS